MEVLYKRCCGPDIHKKSIYACVVIKEGQKRERHLARFGTMTEDILRLVAGSSAQDTTTSSHSQRRL